MNFFKLIFITSMLLSPALASAAKPYMDHGSFLTKEQEINSYRLLPPPPDYKSVIFLNDESSYLYGRSLINTPRWQQAKDDSDLSDDGIGSQFSSVAGLKISSKNTPRLYQFLLKIRKDNDNSINYAKNSYMRVRPFVMFDNQTCAPDDEPFLRHSGSYPSGHATSGWEFALILAEMIPEKSDQILKRGYEYGQSRVICGAHWQSDVDAGRIMGAAILSRLKADKEFNTEFEQVKNEVRNKLKQ